MPLSVRRPSSKTKLFEISVSVRKEARDDGKSQWQRNKRETERDTRSRQRQEREREISCVMRGRHRTNKQ